jgi:tRNA-2-methylthio-N6-dimethylallyladenosine synthase
MNVSDSERIAAVLEKAGYKPASKINEANLIVVNMCSVRQSAVDRVYGLKQKFLNLKLKNKNFKTILTGCMLKQDKKNFETFFDYILDIKSLPHWPKILKKQSPSYNLLKDTI